MPVDLGSLKDVTPPNIGHARPESAYIAQVPVSLPIPGQAPATTFGFSEVPMRLALPQWQTFKPGINNAITDVPGVKVGQVTYNKNEPFHIRTGVTAIVPDAEKLTNGVGNLANTGFKAAVVSLSGNGELTGSSFITEFGVLNGPIMLTNTRSVGMIYEGVERYFQVAFPKQWASQLPVVGECWDGFFNAMEQFVIPADATEQTIVRAKDGPVMQGRVGAGTGMRSFELHAGIGSASRKLTVGEREYTVGVLVNMNHSRLTNMNPLIREQLESRFGSLENLREHDNQDAAASHSASSTSLPQRQGSIQVVIATDLPLATRQLEEVGKRAGLGIGLMGSPMAVSSGDFVTAFTTANPVPMGQQAVPILQTSELQQDELTSVFRAVIEAVLESQTNALIASHNGTR